MKLITVILIASILMLALPSDAAYGPITMRSGANISLDSGNLTDLNGELNISANHLVLGPVNYPTAAYPAESNAYLVLDKSNTASDASIVLRDQGAAKAEIGIITNNDIHFKTVTGPYGSETFTDKFIINNTYYGIDAHNSPWIRNYNTTGSPALIAGNSNLTTGAGLEIIYNQIAKTGSINVAEWGNKYRPLTVSAEHFVVKTGTASVTEALNVTSSGEVLAQNATSSQGLVTYSQVAGTWTAKPYRAIIYQDGSNYVARWANSSLIESTTNFTNVWQNVSDIVSADDGGKIYIEKGNYSYNANYFFRNNVISVGAGRNSTIIRQADDADLGHGMRGDKDWAMILGGIDLAGTRTDDNYYGLEDMQIDFNIAGQTGADYHTGWVEPFGVASAILAVGQNLTFKNLYIKNQHAAGILIDNNAFANWVSNHNTISDIKITATDAHASGVYVTGYVGTNWADTDIRNIDANVPYYAVVLEEQIGINVDGVIANGSGIHASGGSAQCNQFLNFNNIISRDSTSEGILLMSVHGVTVSHAKIYSPTSSGVIVAIDGVSLTCSNLTFDDVSVYDNGANEAFSLVMHNSSLIDCKVYGSASHGIVLLNSNYNTISGYQSSYTGYYGIIVQGTSYYNLITGSLIRNVDVLSGGNAPSIYIHGGKNNTISNNMMLDTRTPSKMYYGVLERSDASVDYNHLHGNIAIKALNSPANVKVGAHSTQADDI